MLEDWNTLRNYGEQVEIVYEGELRIVEEFGVVIEETIDWEHPVGGGEGVK